MKPKDCWYSEVCSLAPQECGPTCVRFAEMLELVKLSNIPEHQWKPSSLTGGEDLEVFRRLKAIKDDIKEWVREGNSLYLYSANYGNGKTSWAIKLMLAYFNQIWRGNCFKCRGVFVSVPEFFDRERQRIGAKDDEFEIIRDNLIRCDLVIWDDISSVKMTDYARATLFNIIDARVLSGKANIYTGNLKGAELLDILGGRLVSRVWNTSEILEFVGEDRRVGSKW